MKIELGKTKIRGFKFKHLTEGVVWDRRMENYIEKEGVIMSIHHEHIYQSMRVKFDDGNSYAYPLEMAKQYIVNEHRFQVDWKDWIDLKEINTKPLAARTFPIPDQYTKEDLIPNFLIGGYTSPNQNEVNRKMPESCKRIAEEINRIVTKINNRSNMKNLKITAPEGYEIDKENSTFENIVFKPIKKELPKSWKELVRISGYYIDDVKCTPTEILNCGKNGREVNIFATKEQAEASLALAQLSQLREVYRDGWKIDWSNDNQYKFCIVFCDDNIDKATYLETHAFLSFQSKEVRDLFLENFRDLIEQAKPLMS